MCSSPLLFKKTGCIFKRSFRFPAKVSRAQSPHAAPLPHAQPPRVTILPFGLISWGHSALCALLVPGFFHTANLINVSSSVLCVLWSGHPACSSV